MNRAVETRIGFGRIEHFSSTGKGRMARQADTHRCERKVLSTRATGRYGELQRIRFLRCDSRSQWTEAIGSIHRIDRFPMVFCVIHRAIVDDHLHHNNAVISGTGTIVARECAEHKIAIVADLSRRSQFVINGGQFHCPGADRRAVVEHNRSGNRIDRNSAFSAADQQAHAK